MRRIMKMFMVAGIITIILSGCGEIEATSAENPDKHEGSVEIEETTDVDETILEENETVNEKEEKEPQYSYVEMAETKYAKSSVNIRDLPSTKGNILGSLSKNESVSVTGQCVETNWYRVDYNGGIGYVSNNYLVNEQIIEVVATTEQTEEPSVYVETNNSGSGGNASSENNQGGGASVIVPEHEETVGNLVWVPTKGGKKYHSKSSCSNMEEPMQVSEDTAITNGYTACKRCH